MTPSTCSEPTKDTTVQTTTTATATKDPGNEDTTSGDEKACGQSRSGGENVCTKMTMTIVPVLLAL